ncbi:MAG: lysophospholipid acyltransferase family protein [Methylophilaceae bacterium]|nr:lysophospholipid acyltransferase family protein [Methylophilaceae bacterium]
MIKLMLKLLASLPLPLLHWLGSALGHILFLSAKKAKLRTIKNMQQSGLFADPIADAVNKSFISLGKAILETPYIWGKDNQTIAKLMQNVKGWETVEAAIKAKKGIIFLTPHMGCFEITSLYFALHHPITVLYRPPKQKWMRPLVAGRARNNITLAEANANGVRQLLKALKKGEAIGILPDQAPRHGEGEWADFYQKPAYTMTLASKLSSKTQAAVIMAYGERLNHGKGYTLHLTAIDSIDTPSLLNKAIEQQIKQQPSQYYWNYKRYKTNRKSKAKST